ncbi:MAG: branched-chain amino acid ABC transporter permease [Nitrososphaerales archaeon]
MAELRLKSLTTLSSFKAAGLILIIIMIAVPAVLRDPYLIHVLTLGSIYAVFAMSWDILMYTNQLSLGHSFFFGLSAYLTAVFNSSLRIHPILAIALAVAITALIGLGLSIPFFKLRGAYYALGMAGLAEIATLTVKAYSDITGGEEGIRGIIPLTADYLGNYYIALAVMLASLIFLYYIAEQSRFALIFRAIRDDEIAAKSLGIAVHRYRLLCLVLGAAFAGLGGAVYATYLTIVNPNVMAIVPTTALVVTMGMVGGVNTIIGPALGAYLIVFLNSFFRVAENIRLLAYALTATLILLFLPGGVIRYVMRGVNYLMRLMRG